VHVIPVIDIRHGVAVRAVAGDRANYAPLVTPLCEGCDPRDVVAGMLRVHPFNTVYVADLDGIEGRGGNNAVIAALQTEFPSVELWVDQGARDRHEVELLLNVRNVLAVLGSETGIGPGELVVLQDSFSDRLIVSLDYKAGVYVGDPQLLEQSECWSERVIAMSLAKVGMAGGPDFALITALRQRRADVRLYAAGGVRNGADLEAAAAAGATGALVSSALHQGTVSGGDLRKFGASDASGASAGVWR
jgi:HisA/HisF family protein